MPSILDLFKSKEFQSKKLSAGFPDAPPSPMDTEAVLEKFTTDDLYKFGTNYSLVKSDKETFIEQETSGIRIRSAVELNNPLIYGNEAIRIMNRTTSAVEDMKSATGGSEGDGGLIGKALDKLSGGKVTSISSVRNEFNKALKIPITPIPSRVITEVIDSNPNSDKEGSKLPSSTPITKELFQDGSSEFGKLLKQSGGGNPKTLGKQALGNGIGLAKERLRGKLFGSQQTIGDVVGEKVETNYSNTNPYTKVLQDNRDYKKEGGSVGYEDLGFEDEFKGIDLSLVSPIHGVRRVGKVGDGEFTQDGRFGRTEYAFQTENSFNAGVRYTPQDKQNYTQVNGYESSLILKRGFNGRRGDKIILNPNSYEELDLASGKAKIGGNEYVDLVPFWIGNYGSSKPTLFRAVITGLTETVSPSWSSNNFIGNPYKYYIYESIERSTSFNLSLYCNNPLELSANWERITKLTKMAYPSVQRNLVNPPFIWFKLGDIYTKKAGIIESLTYTMPDNGVWETETDGFILPKFIDVAITIKFVENVGDGLATKLYGYKKSKEALKKEEENQRKEQREAQATTSTSKTRKKEAVYVPEYGDWNVDPNDENLFDKLDARGYNFSTEDGKKGKKVPKDYYSGKDSKDVPAQDSSNDPVLAQSAANDSLGGKSVEESVKEAEQTVLPSQSTALVSLQSQGYKRVPNSDNQLQSEFVFAVGDRTNMIGMSNDSENKFAVIFGDGGVVIRNYRN